MACVQPRPERDAWHEFSTFKSALRRAVSMIIAPRSQEVKSARRSLILRELFLANVGPDSGTVHLCAGLFRDPRVPTCLVRKLLGCSKQPARQVVHAVRKIFKMGDQDQSGSSAALELRQLSERRSLALHGIPMRFFLKPLSGVALRGSRAQNPTGNPCVSCAFVMKLLFGESL